MKTNRNTEKRINDITREFTDYFSRNAWAGMISEISSRITHTRNAEDRHTLGTAILWATSPKYRKSFPAERVPSKCKKKSYDFVEMIVQQMNARAALYDTPVAAHHGGTLTGIIALGIMLRGRYRHWSTNDLVVAAIAVARWERTHR